MLTVSLEGLKNRASSNYTLQILTLCTYMCIFAGEVELLLTLILATVSIGIKEIILVFTKTRKPKREEDTKVDKLPIGFYLCVSNVIVLIIMTLLK